MRKIVFRFEIIRMCLIKYIQYTLLFSFNNIELEIQNIIQL